MLRKNIKFYEDPTSGVGENVVKYNMTAFQSDAAFGCGGRMNLVLFPLSALVPAPNDAKVLIVGPRTEDDIFLAKALGFTNTKGLDLFTYSPYIELGDIHALPYAPGEYDAVVLGWVLAYSSEPAKAIDQCMTVLKKGGHLAIGWEWVPESGRKTNTHIRGNSLNEVDDFKNMVNCQVVFLNDPDTETNHHKSIIFKR